MSNVVIEIEKIQTGYVLFVRQKYKTKYWCWSYTNEQTAQHVKSKIDERWDECPVQKYEDYVEIFVTTTDQIQHTDIDISDMTESWINTPAVKINLKQVSGK